MVHLDIILVCCKKGRRHFSKLDAMEILWKESLVAAARGNLGWERAKILCCPIAQKENTA